MSVPAPLPRHLAVVVLLAMAGFVAAGYLSIRRDVESLRVISQDNILWTATQMEVELMRFQLSVAKLKIEQSEQALKDLGERYEILLSRVGMMEQGRVGALIRRYDEGYDSIRKFDAYLKELDPLIASLEADDSATLQAVLRELETFQQELRLYTLRVVRGDTAAAAEVRDRIQSSSQTAMFLSVGAVLLSALSLGLIIRENRRQAAMAELNRRLAEEAARASRAKSRFLTMMSHELRNPMNGVLGPLALLSQSDLPPRQGRLVEQAQQSGQSMVQMLAGLLDWGEIQDGKLTLRADPFRLGALAASVREDLNAAGLGAVRVFVRGGAGELMLGDIGRFRQIYVHLAEYVLEGGDHASVDIAFTQTEDTLVGEIAFPGDAPAMDWKIDLMMGLGDFAPDQVSSDALRPLIARGLIAAAKGMLVLVDGADGRRAIRVTIPAPAVRRERVRVRLDTRSAALAAIYEAALRSDRLAFVGADDPGSVDVVLIDATSAALPDALARLRERHPEALFVALGSPESPDEFDDVLETPADVTRLRTSLLGRFAS